jgi:hypothetical protein
MSDTDSIDTPRTAEQIARRAIALHCTIAAAHGVSRADISEWLQEEGLWEELYDIRCELEKVLRNGKTSPQGFDKDVAFFRHYGLSWVVGYCGQAWDEITPDT